MGDDWSAASWYLCPEVKMSPHAFNYSTSCLQKMWQWLQPSYFLPRSSHCFLSIHTPTGSGPAYMTHFWCWVRSCRGMFAECCALQDSQEMAATVIFCYLNLGQPAALPGAIWWTQRMSRRHSAENGSFCSSRILQAPAWGFYTICMFVCWSCVYTSEGKTLAMTLAPGPAACQEQPLEWSVSATLLGHRLGQF